MITIFFLKQEGDGPLDFIPMQNTIKYQDLQDWELEKYSNGALL